MCIKYFIKDLIFSSRYEVGVLILVFSSFSVFDFDCNDVNKTSIKLK